MRRKKRYGGGALIVLADFEAEHPVLHDVHAAHAIVACDLVHREDQFQRSKALAVQGYRDPILEADLQHARRVRAVREAARPPEDLFRGGVVRLLQAPALDAATPQVLIYAPDLLFGLGDAEAVGIGIVYLLAARPGFASPVR